MSVVATVFGAPIAVSEVDAREARLRATVPAAALPRPGTSEGRQLRRWLTQLLVAERVVAAEAAALGLREADAPAEDTLLPDTAARLEIGSIASSVLADPRARAVFAHVTARVDVTDADVDAYYRRNPLQFRGFDVVGGWRRPGTEPAPLPPVAAGIRAGLLAAAQRREFRRWLDARCAAAVHLAPGYEHPGDPTQPDNTHRH
jgi:[acyl-carrier-protein] S-malonyltransferase